MIECGCRKMRVNGGKGKEEKVMMYTGSRSNQLVALESDESSMVPRTETLDDLPNSRRFSIDSLLSLCYACPNEDA